MELSRRGNSDYFLAGRTSDDSYIAITCKVLHDGMDISSISITLKCNAFCHDYSWQYFKYKADRFKTSELSHHKQTLLIQVRQRLLIYSYHNDTIINSPVLKTFDKDSNLSSSEVHALLNKNLSLVTIKRHLSDLLKEGFLIQYGAGRSIKYSLSKKGLFLRPLDTKSYLGNNPDDRLRYNNYRFDLFEKPYIELFTSEELNILENATENFRDKSNLTNDEIRKKELMRFIIEFSWKTSQIEGNTYDIISTEKLLLYSKKSSTNTEYEAQMIINQKDALEFILENTDDWEKPNLALIEKLHDYVGKDLNFSKGFRKSLVGITGTNYRPLENESQIKEAVENLLNYLGYTNRAYDQALLSVLGLSYIYP